MQKTVDRSNTSFDFYPQEWLVSTEWRKRLTFHERGLLFERVLQAVEQRDEEFLRQCPFVGRVYWREKVSRPPLTAALRRAVFERDGRACVLCGSTYKLEIDHFIPYSKGGLHEIENLRVLCKPCNRKKHNKMPESSRA